MLQIDVFQTDAEAYEATAGRAAELLREMAQQSHRAAVALAGGRSGRGVMVALAAHSEVPWEHIDWFWGDDRCVPDNDPHSNVKLARDSLLASRRIAVERIHPPSDETGDPHHIARRYAECLRRIVGGEIPVLDLVFLGVGVDAHIASLAPGSQALRATEPYAAVAVSEVESEPRLARITVTPPVLQAARHVLVTVVGVEKAAAVAASLAEVGDVTRTPARLVQPSERVEWRLDRGAATELLRHAQPVVA